jgi:hypothetical protein
MKKLLVTLAAVLVSVSAFAQGTTDGTINFNNRGLSPADAPVRGDTAGATAQLFLVGAGGGLTPLLPTTTFRTGAAAAFVNAALVSVPGVPAGGSATVRMRAWRGAASYDAAVTTPGAAWCESNNVLVNGLGGVPPTPGAPPITPPNLNGLTEFALIPEPSTIALGVLGAAALLLRRRK